MAVTMNDEYDQNLSNHLKPLISTILKQDRSEPFHCMDDLYRTFLIIYPQYYNDTRERMFKIIVCELQMESMRKEIKYLRPFVFKIVEQDPYDRIFRAVDIAYMNFIKHYPRFYNDKNVKFLFPFVLSQLQMEKREPPRSVPPNKNN